MDREREKDILEWIYCIVIAIIIAIFIKYFVGTPTVVQQESMYPTLIQGDRLLLSRISRTLKKLPQRGEIITFEAPSKLQYSDGEADLSNPIAKYENDPTSIWGRFTHNVLEIGKTSYIKRVIGVPGDHIEIKNGKVYRNSEEIKEDYLQNDVDTISNGPFDNFIVPKNTVFAMGDNREASMDCRAFGCIPLNKIESKVAIRFWPISKFGKVK